jgi:hypothetical protein
MMPSSKVNNFTTLLRPSQRVELGRWNDKEDKDRPSRSMVVNRGFESVLMQPEMSALLECQCGLATMLSRRSFVPPNLAFKTVIQG